MKLRQLSDKPHRSTSVVKTLCHVLALVCLSACGSDARLQKDETLPELLYDSHVHIMSPQLISDWKELGIPFSKSEANYSNIDTLLANSTAHQIDLVGMSYVYGNPEYYQGEDGYKRMMAENDYLLEAAGKYSKRIRPYFAIDPLKESALTEIERCVQINPKSGLKLHFNASQVYLTEPDHLEKVKKILTKSAELGLPVLLHFDNWHPKFGAPDLELLMDSILTHIPAINLRFAHFGTSGGFNDKTKEFINAYLALKANNRVPARHKIYFDISAVALDKESEGVSKLSSNEFKELAQYTRKIGVENIVFGTDYPLYNSADYLKVLREKLQLTSTEVEQIMKPKTSVIK